MRHGSPFFSVWALVGFSLVYALPLAKAEIYIMSHFELNPLPDMEANFGPPIPPEGIQGELRLADPEDGCSDFTYTDFEHVWIALISRQHSVFHSLNCTFDIKIRMAQAAGAVAAIVYDDVYEGLVIMAKPEDHKDPDIPGVFVSLSSGLMLKRMLVLEDSVTVTIVPSTDAEWISLLMSAFLALLAFLLVMLTLYVMRTWSMLLNRTPPLGTLSPGGQETNGLGNDVLQSLPIWVYEKPARRRPSNSQQQQQQQQQAEGGQGNSRAALASSEESAGEPPREALAGEAASPKADALLGSGAASVSGDSSDCGCVPAASNVHAGETKRTCVVCLENYVEGDKLRILPCYHRFHMDCVDHWLATHRICPVCKWDASTPKVELWPVQDPSTSTLESVIGRVWDRVVSLFWNPFGSREQATPSLEHEPLMQPLMQHAAGSSHADIEQGGGASGVVFDRGAVDLNNSTGVLLTTPVLLHIPFTDGSSATSGVGGAQLGGQMVGPQPSGSEGGAQQSGSALPVVHSAPTLDPSSVAGATVLGSHVSADALSAASAAAAAAAAAAATVASSSSSSTQSIYTNASGHTPSEAGPPTRSGSGSGSSPAPGSETGTPPDIVAIGGSARSRAVATSIDQPSSAGGELSFDKGHLSPQQLGMGASAASCCDGGVAGSAEGGGGTGSAAYSIPFTQLGSELSPRTHPQQPAWTGAEISPDPATETPKLPSLH